jgi:chorismate mutase / prephenate dehydratase
MFDSFKPWPSGIVERMTDESKLAKLREQIDDIDEKLVALLSERARLALEIGIAKGEQTAVYQPAREQTVLEHARAVNKGPLSGEGIQTIFGKIIEVCRTIQFNKQQPR